MPKFDAGGLQLPTQKIIGGKQKHAGKTTAVQEVEKVDAMVTTDITFFSGIPLAYHEFDYRRVDLPRLT